MQYLKPNFSKHPLNFVFVLLIALGSFSFSSIALADTYIVAGEPTATGGTPEAACRAYSDYMSGWSGNNTWAYSDSTETTCSLSYWYYETKYIDYPIIFDSVPNGCPDPGVTKRVEQVINGYYDD